MRGRLIRVEHLLGKLMEKVMPEGIEERGHNHSEPVSHEVSQVCNNVLY